MHYSHRVLITAKHHDIIQNLYMKSLQRDWRSIFGNVRFHSLELEQQKILTCISSWGAEGNIGMLPPVSDQLRLNKTSPLRAPLLPDGRARQRSVPNAPVSLIFPVTAALNTNPHYLLQTGECSWAPPTSKVHIYSWKFRESAAVDASNNHNQ